jgi:hypothetical protein
MMKEIQLLMKKKNIKKENKDSKKEQWKGQDLLELIQRR